MSPHDAWTTWWSGKRLPDDAMLLGVKVIWLGRIGLLMALIGTLMVVLDLIGTERVRQLSEAVSKRASNLIFQTSSLNKAIVRLSVIYTIGAFFLVALAELDHISLLFHLLFLITAYGLAIILSLNLVGLVGFTAAFLIYLSGTILAQRWSAPFFKIASWMLAVVGATMAMLSA
jgi:hypothetical protein